MAYSRSRRRKIMPDEGAGMGGHLLGLSLFIMLLAFFIVLTAMSSFQESKVKSGLNSLEGVFATQALEDVIKLPSAVESERQSAKEGDTLERMQALFAAQIPSYAVKVNKRRGIMMITVPYQDFVSAVNATEPVNAGKDGAGQFGELFLSVLVSLLHNDAAGMPYRMDVMLNTTENPARMQRQEPEKTATLMAELGALAEKIEKTGLPQKFLSVGLQRGRDGMVELIFRPHIPYNPLQQEKAE